MATAHQQDNSGHEEAQTEKPLTTKQKFVRMYTSWFDGPITWFREQVVIPNRAGNVYYHRKFLRVPTIDECYVDDVVCAYEANQQWKRDRKVETMIVHILKRRWATCVHYHEKSLEFTKCDPLLKEYQDAENAWFIKNGDLGFTATARDAYFKQVHRLILERRENEAKKQRQEAAYNP